MAYAEKDFQSAWNRWLKFNWEGGSAGFELKITKKSSLPFSRVEAHQIQALLDVKHGSLIYKISDQSIGFKPFDSFILTDAPAYVVIMYYKPRKQKRVCIIDVDTFVNEINTSKRKSLGEERAEEIAEQVIDLNNIEIT